MHQPETQRDWIVQQPMSSLVDHDILRATRAFLSLVIQTAFGKSNRQIENMKHLPIPKFHQIVEGEPGVLHRGARTHWLTDVVNPPPFLVLDETDAALDEANSQRYAAILKELSKRTQLILVTHNRETMKNSGILYGVTMGDDGVSRLLSLKLEEAEVYTNR